MPNIWQRIQALENRADGFDLSIAGISVSLSSINASIDRIDRRSRRNRRRIRELSVSMHDHEIRITSLSVSLAGLPTVGGGGTNATLLADVATLQTQVAAHSSSISLLNTSVSLLPPQLAILTANVSLLASMAHNIPAQIGINTVNISTLTNDLNNLILVVNTLPPSIDPQTAINTADISALNASLSALEMQVANISGGGTGGVAEVKKDLDNRNRYYHIRKGVRN